MIDGDEIPVDPRVHLGKTTTCPMPGEQFDGGTVVASGWYRDDIFGVMTLRDKAPYYLIGEYPILGYSAHEAGDTLGCVIMRRAFPNIVPAAVAFDEQFGFWGLT